MQLIARDFAYRRQFENTIEEGEKWNNGTNQNNDMTETDYVINVFNADGGGGW